MFRNWPFCKRMSIRKVFKLPKGGRTGYPPKPRPARPKPKCPSLCAQDTKGRTDSSCTRAGNLATIEKHRPVGELRGVEKKKKGVVISKGAQYHNPDAMTRLIGPRNITRVEVNGVEMKALMDSGSQVNMMTEKFLKKTRVNPETIGKSRVKTGDRRVCWHRHPLPGIYRG